MKYDFDAELKEILNQFSRNEIDWTEVASFIQRAIDKGKCDELRKLEDLDYMVNDRVDDYCESRIAEIENKGKEGV